MKNLLHLSFIFALCACTSSPKTDPGEAVRQYLFLEKMHDKCLDNLKQVEIGTEQNEVAIKTQSQKCEQLQKRMNLTRKKSGLRSSAWNELYLKEVQALSHP